ncbi:sugar ABC transporter substrate-binding protein [Brachybacterium nesterenkovii]|uniref:sugar ABC transporter substrate-binding protein n=1 Tax=Brachybacterium nesterenkovii TaxID=47847 RepID=UPI0032192DB2
MTTISRRLFAGLSIAAVAGTATACGRSESGGDAKSAEPIAEGKATGELTVWAMGAEGEKLPELLKGFQEENPDCKVSVTAVPWDSAHDKFTSAIAAGTAPDVAQVGSTWMSEFVGLKALQPVPEEIDLSGFFEGAQKSVTVEDVKYGVPWYVETRVVYYRKDLAEAAGITEAPTDWDTYKTMVKALKDNGAAWGTALQPGGKGSWESVMPFVWSNGGSVISEDLSEFTFESDENTEALAFYQSFFTEGLANKAPAEGTTEQDFVSGAAPMFISGPWMMSGVEKLGGDGFADKYGVFQIPKKESSTSFLGGANLGVFDSTKNRDAAWKLVQYLAEPEVQAQWFTISTDLPAVEKAWDDESVGGNEKFDVFHEQLKSAIAPPAVGTWEQVITKFDDQVEQVCKEGLDPAQALKTAQADATSIGMGA